MGQVWTRIFPCFQKLHDLKLSLISETPEVGLGRTAWYLPNVMSMCMLFIQVMQKTLHYSFSVHVSLFCDSQRSKSHGPFSVGTGPATLFP